MVAVMGLALWGCSQTASGPARYAIEVGTEGYTPAHVKAKPGQEVVLVFTRTTNETCGTEVVIPSENKTMSLPLNQPVEVHLVAKEKGEIAFHCGMNMLQGSVEVN
jgi:plastocyanin domain-containing protein